LLEKIVQKAWMLKTLFTGVGTISLVEFLACTLGTISLVEFLACTQEVCGGRACVAFGLGSSREFEEASEAIEVPK